MYRKPVVVLTLKIGLNFIVMKLTNQSYSATVRTFVPSVVTSPLSMKDRYEKMLKFHILGKIFKVLIENKQSLPKYEPSIANIHRFCVVYGVLPWAGINAYWRFNPYAVDCTEPFFKMFMPLLL